MTFARFNTFTVETDKINYTLVEYNRIFRIGLAAMILLNIIFIVIRFSAFDSVQLNSDDPTKAIVNTFIYPAISIGKITLFGLWLARKPSKISFDKSTQLLTHFERTKPIPFAELTARVKHDPISTSVELLAGPNSTPLVFSTNRRAEVLPFCLMLIELGIPVTYSPRLAPQPEPTNVPTFTNTIGKDL